MSEMSEEKKEEKRNWRKAKAIAATLLIAAIPAAIAVGVYHYAINPPTKRIGNGQA